MKAEVKAKLDAIFAFPFFNSVGKPLPSGVSRVNTWPQAAKSCSFVKWKNNKLMARNAIQDAIQNQYPKPGMWERMQEWGPLGEESGPIIDSFVNALLPKIPLKDKNLQNIKNALLWDICFICLECHYADIVKPVFYIPIIEQWYAAGHFPCGWDGDEFPDSWDGIIRGGQLIIF